jgi:hypothetical protein
MDCTDLIFAKSRQIVSDNFWGHNLEGFSDYLFHLFRWERPANITEILDVEHLTDLIKNGLDGWVKAGLALIIVKENFKEVLNAKLAKSWKQYCLNFFNRSVWQVGRLMDAARVYYILENSFQFNILPTCEAQCRPLVKFLPEDFTNTTSAETEEIINYWRQAIALAGDKPVTTNIVETVVNGEDYSETARVKISANSYQKLSDLAFEMGFKNVKDLLENVDKLSINKMETDEYVEEDCEEDCEEETENETPQFHRKKTRLVKYVDSKEYKEKIRLWELYLQQLCNEYERSLSISNSA